MKKSIVSCAALKLITSSLQDLEEVSFVVDGNNLLIAPVDTDLCRIIGTLCIPFRSDDSEGPSLRGINEQPNA